MKNIKEYYQNKYKSNLFIVKAGGRIITDDNARESLLSDIKDLTDAGIKILLIYGGGHAIDDALERAGITPQKNEGRRITSAESIPIVQKALNDLGEQISSTMTSIDLDGQVLSHLPVDWGTLGFRERENKDDTGYDGFFESVESAPIRAMFGQADFIACPCIGVSKKNAVNINADNVASAIAKGVQSLKLIFLSDVDGVMKDGILLDLVTDAEIPGLIETGVAEGGMQVKLENCMEALNAGVRRIHLINGFKKHALTGEIYNSVGPGTMIIKEEDRASYLNEIEAQQSY